MARLREFVARFTLPLYVAAALGGGTFAGYTMVKNRSIAREARASAHEAKAATDSAALTARKAKAASDRAHQAALDANRALCLLRSSAQHRLLTAQQFKREHPNGTESFSLTLVNRSIRAATSDLEALEGVECPKR